MIWLGLYMASIVAANLTLALVGVVPVGFGLMAPAGVLWAGAALTLRDMVQERLGRHAVLAAIVAAAALSAIVAPSFALASAVAFALSELADFAIYTPLRARGWWLVAVAGSNTVGLVVDSALFLLLAFGSLEYLGGQLVGKAYVTAATVALLWLGSRRRASCSFAR
jgi:uncharacterized PurR-regulated membrane protein YhhQ (DUF165 family)